MVGACMVVVVGLNIDTGSGCGIGDGIVAIPTAPHNFGEFGCVK